MSGVSDCRLLPCSYPVCMETGLHQHGTVWSDLCCHAEGRLCMVVVSVLNLFCTGY